MTTPDPMSDALASTLAAALPAGTHHHIGDTRVVAAFQAERLAEAGYMLVSLNPDEATIERLAKLVCPYDEISTNMDRTAVRRILAALAGTETTS